MKFKAGEILLAEGAVPQTAYRVQQGSVEMTRQEDGAAMPIDVLDRGSLIGAEELIDGTPMPATAQALGMLVAETVSKEQAMKLLGRRAPAKKPAAAAKAAMAEAAHQVRSGTSLVAFTAPPPGAGDDDPAASVLKPGLLRRLLKPDFADVYDRLDVRIAALGGAGGELASAHLMNEIGQRRGLRARAVNAAISLQPSSDPIAAMAELRRAAGRWLADNGGDVLIWGECAEPGGVAQIRLFVADDAPIDSYRIGDGWTMLALPDPLDAAAAHRVHGAVLASLRTSAAGKLLTQRRDLDVLIADARTVMLTDTPGFAPLARAEDRAGLARIFANATRYARRADDARTAIGLLDQALAVFNAERTPLEWAMAHRDRALLGQFVAERTNDTDALRASVVDIEAALQVLGPGRLPYDWAVLSDRLGRAMYRLDFDNGDIEILDRALGAFENALSVFDRRTTPAEWTETMAHLGQVALVIGRERRSPSTLLRAVEACHAVVSMRDRRHMPQHWASAQNNLGSALFLYGRIAGDIAALTGARDAFRTARTIYVEKGSDRLARIAQKNLDHVDRALSRRAQRAAPRQLPWEPGEDNGPPPLPWELDAAGDGPSADDVWRDDRLR